MQFLMNDVVLSLHGAKLSPKVASRRFQALPFNAVSKLGAELFAENPLLHAEQPERARRLATLIIAKAPTINAALFIAPSYGCAPDEVSLRYASVDFELMARLCARQADGLLDTLWTDREVWRRLAA